MKKIIFSFCMMFLVSILYSQTAPSSYTAHYQFRQWASGANPSADSLNANWSDIDTWVYYADTSAFKLHSIDTITTSNLFESVQTFDTVYFSYNGQIVLPQMTATVIQGGLRQKIDPENGSKLVTTFGTSSGNEEIFATREWCVTNLDDSLGSISSSTDQSGITGIKTFSTLQGGIIFQGAAIGVLGIPVYSNVTTTTFDGVGTDFLLVADIYDNRIKVAKEYGADEILKLTTDDVMRDTLDSELKWGSAIEITDDTLDYDLGSIFYIDDTNDSLDVNYNLGKLILTNVSWKNILLEIRGGTNGVSVSSIGTASYQGSWPDGISLISVASGKIQCVSIDRYKTNQFMMSLGQVFTDIEVVE